MIKYKDLQEFLLKHTLKTDDKKTKKNVYPTHTRIPDKNLNIYGGSYNIPDNEWSIFMQLYHEYVFVKKKPEYLTEKQLLDESPILVDFDLHYDVTVHSRIHTKTHIFDMLAEYLEELKNFFIFEENKPFYVYIMEKPNVNKLSDNSKTKDGIHMLIGIKMNRVMQQMLREKMIIKISTIWSDLPIINSWDKVLDETISRGTTNWQMYGSRKPDNQAYELTQIFEIKYDLNDSEFMLEEISLNAFTMNTTNLMKLSAQYKDNPTFEFNPCIMHDYNLAVEKSKTKTRKSTSKMKMKLLYENEDGLENEEEMREYTLEEITNYEILKKAMDYILKSLKPNEQDIREIHEYTQILPEKYYKPGSHLLNRQVAFALKHTDNRLFLSWVMLRSKASDFDYSTIPDLYLKWKNYFTNNKEEVVTKKSIMYWARQDAPLEYHKVKRNTLDYYLEESLISRAENDFARVLYHIYKDTYVCVSRQNRIWYVFKNNRWVLDPGHSLRLIISKELYQIYQDKADGYINEIQQLDPNTCEERIEMLKKKVININEVSIKFKKTTDKNNIMSEASELFYDQEFIKKMDSNRYLLCFNNGVIDFKKKEFRCGYPNDYITKTTDIDYISLNDKTNDDKTNKTIEEINTFMKQLFPIQELNQYMWEHLASCLIGVNLNQTFNIYLGSGSNGKSKLTDLMSYALGQYKGTVPITLVTDKRTAIGGASSEIIQLKGVRYAVMQEPSKDMKINEGMMKELTGGDPIQARALYSEMETFIPQFKLVVCTNTLFLIESNDDGTWRRIRLCDFKSKFVGENEKHTDDTPYVFPKDNELEDKLPKWAPIFASMLVNIAFETGGFVKDCNMVLASSNKYRQTQDHITGFIQDMIIYKEDGRIKKKELWEQFKMWFQESYGTQKPPKGAELVEQMEKKFGKCTSSEWRGIAIKYPELMDDVDDLH